MGKRKADHVWANLKESRMECDHCKRTYPLVLPASLGMVAAICKQWDKDHRNCQPVKEVAHG